MTTLFDGWEPVLRVILIGPLAYASLVLILRMSGKRSLSQMNAFDFVVTIALGSTFATVIIDQSVSLVTGIAGFAVLIAAQFVVTWISARHYRFEKLLKSEATLLYRDGEMLRKSLRRMRVTERDVEAIVRRAGQPNMDTVAAVILEADGSVSVISDDGELKLPNVGTEAS